MPNLSNVLNILLASLFLQKIQIFKTFNFGTLFGKFNCGKSLEYFSHLLNISHICKDSDIQKIPLPENTILSLGQNLNITFSTSLHFTPLHFTPNLSASLPATLCNFTSPPILSASLHATSRRIPLFLSHFTPLHFTHFVFLTSCHFTPFFPPCCMPLHSTSFTSPPILSASLHATSRRLPLFLSHFTPLHFSTHFVFLTSCHFTSCHSFHLTACHFTPLHFSHFVHITSCHFTLPPILFASLHFSSCHFTLTVVSLLNISRIS